MMTRRKYVKEKPDARRLGSQKTLHLFGEHLRHIHIVIQENSMTWKVLKA